MKTIFGIIYLLLLVNTDAKNMDTTDIKELIQHMDDSLARGSIYQISYTLLNKRTDAFYNHRKELIKFLADYLATKMDTFPASEVAQERQNNLMLQESFKRQLSIVRERATVADYSMDGKGFYLKQTTSYIGADGKKMIDGPAIYVSDGKIMGTFYLNDSQGVLQPATERPQGGGEYWTDVTNFFAGQSISSFMGQMPDLKIAEDAGDLIVSGDQFWAGNERVHQELRINKRSLTPQSLISDYTPPKGLLTRKTVKTWQYQSYSGLMLPQSVVEQQFNAGLDGKVELEEEKIFTINNFSIQPKNTKEELAVLLRSDFSVFDEISGTRYLTGNAADALDHLSK
jgi:hypothetical protein